MKKRDHFFVSTIPPLLLATIAVSSDFAHAGVCPSVGLDTDCGTVITIFNTGATVFSTGQGPYDGVEDTLVGVINNTNQPIRAIGLISSLPVFAFEGDGIVAYGISGNSVDGTGYGGPNAYFNNIDSSDTTGTVNFINPIPPGKSAFFSLEEALNAAVSCGDAINNTLTVSLSGQSQSNGSFLNAPEINASFKPNSSLDLAQAALICGFKDFNWQQLVTALPSPSPVFQVGSATPKTAPPAFLDPPPGGWTYDPQWDSAPFFWDIKSTTNVFSLERNKTFDTLSFFDAPGDFCLPDSVTGLPSKAWTSLPLVRADCQNKTAPFGSYMAFKTHLVGVNFDDTATDLGIGFTWTSNFNGTPFMNGTGGIAIAQLSSLLPIDPDSGTGGITITSVQNVTTYQNQGLSVTTVNGVPVGHGTTGGGQVNTLASGSTCDGVYGGTFNGNITVSNGQNCRFVDGHITGNVQQNGGNLALTETLVNGDVQVKGSSTFSIGSSVTINGNLEIQNIQASTARNQVCGATVYGNLGLQNNSTSVQIGGASLSSCLGNVIVGNFNVENNNASTALFNNSVTGNLHVDNNTASTQVIGNAVLKNLECQNNAAITGAGNKAKQKQGQCLNF